MVLELRHLRYFVSVATERSFSRASEQLHIAQPPLSRQIQQLEKELGTQLLHRGRPITLTESGRYFFEHARAILRRIDEMRAMMQRIEKREIGAFGIGFVPSALYDVIPELIRRFRLTMPGVEVVLSELTTLEQTSALRKGRIDIGFGRLRFEDEGLTRIVLREERLVMAVPNGHPLTRISGPLELKRTVSERLILYPRAPRPSYADQVLSFYHDLGLSPNVDFEVRELQTALGLVASGAGVSLVPSSVRRIGRDDVVYLEMSDPNIVSPIIMTYRTNDTSPLLENIRVLVREFDNWTPTGGDQPESAALIPAV
jgi:LysR family transcriptional regulator, benzoate and cis,cis-muconate-responsive activator of ben and cat genes